MSPLVGFFANQGDYIYYSSECKVISFVKCCNIHTAIAISRNLVFIKYGFTHISSVMYLLSIATPPYPST